MDPKFQPSFIPKKDSSGEDPLRQPKMSGGLLYLLGTSLFVLALISSVGVFVYEKYMGGRIAKMQTDLEMAKQTLDPELVKELSRSYSRVSSAKEILSKHVSFTSFFTLLEEETLQSVRFMDFSALINSDNTVSVQMGGEAVDYKTIALQSDIISENPNLRNPSFSNFSLSDDGNVSFRFKANIVPDFILFERSFESTQSLPNTTTEPSVPSFDSSSNSNQIEVTEGPAQNPS